MGKQPIEPWIAELVWAELAAVITWSQNRSGRPNSSSPDSRFSDDGSNFRSAVELPQTSQDMVQLIKVLSVKGTPTVLLSDGHSKIKARLSKNAVATLEAEIEETFSFDVVGDVFRLKTFTVVSTPFGPSDSFIQFSVDSIEYEHHLRKITGQPTAIADHDDIRLLLDDITRLRCPQPALADRLDDDGEGAQASRRRETSESGNQRIAKSFAHPNGSNLHVPQTQVNGLAEQSRRLSKKRPLAATLEDDGFQLEAGVNLDRPLQPDSGLGRSNLGLPQQAAPDGSVDRTKRLLELFGGNKQPPVAVQRAAPTQQSIDVISETPAKLKSSVASIVESTKADVPPTTYFAPSEEGLRSGATSNRSPPSAQPDAPRPSAESMHRRPLSKAARRRHKIPANQQKLLDHPSSWLPSLPGHRFPQPNVPIELLSKWNACNSRPDKERSPKHSQAAAPQRKTRNIVSDAPVRESDESESEEELPSSQWPRSPSQRSTNLPPESTIGSLIRGTQQDDLDIEVPRALPFRKSSGNQRSSMTMSEQSWQPPGGSSPGSQLERLDSSLESPDGRRKTPSSMPQSPQQFVIHTQDSLSRDSATYARPAYVPPTEPRSHRVASPRSHGSRRGSPAMPPPRSPRPGSRSSQSAISAPRSSWRNQPMVGRGSSQSYHRTQDSPCSRVRSTPRDEALLYDSYRPPPGQSIGSPEILDSRNRSDPQSSYRTQHPPQDHAQLKRRAYRDSEDSYHPPSRQSIEPAEIHDSWSRSGAPASYPQSSLRQDPAELNRRTRRDFMQSSRRRDW